MAGCKRRQVKAQGRGSRDKSAGKQRTRQSAIWGVYRGGGLCTGVMDSHL